MAVCTMALTPPDGHRLLLLLCVVTVGLFGTALCSQPLPICDISCCTALPSCGDALQVTCNCTQQDSVILRKGEISKKVQTIDIYNARTVVIDKDAVNDLKHLTSFSMHGINQLEIKENGMAFDKESNIRSVKIQDIETLHIKSKAFSGLWETGANISISHITELRIETNAFAWISTSLWPSLALQHVGLFNLHSKGFAAPLYVLSLNHVNMSTCHNQSFGGKIKSIQFNKVTIDEVNARCFSDLGSLSTFTIQSSTMKTVRPQAFSGNIHELIIKNSSFTSMDERSLDIRTDYMQIASSHIKHLNTNALSVMAKDLRLENSRVDYLAKHALAGLEIQRSEVDYAPLPLVIRNLNILSAESGSLFVSNCTEIQMTDLSIVAPWPIVCPTEQWVRQLVGATASGPLHPAQFEVFMQLLGKHLCAEDSHMPFPAMTDELSSLCATRSRGPLDYFVYDEYDENSRDSLPDVSREDGDGGTPRGRVDSRGEKAYTSNREQVQTEGSLVGGHSAEVDGSYRKPAPIEPRAEPDPDPSGPVAGTTSPATEDQLMSYLSLGAMLVLTVVLLVLVVVLLLLRRRRCRGQQPTSDLPQILEKQAAGMVTRDGDGERPHITSGSSTLDLVSPTDSNHLYEPIRQDLPQPPVYHQYEPMRQSRPLPPTYHQYEPIRPDLLPVGPPPSGPNPRISQYDDSYAGSQVYASLLDR